MNKKTKYYYIITRVVTMFIITLIIGALLKIAAIYQYLEPDIFSVLTIILHVINTILIIAICCGGVYLMYQIIRYTSSIFYKDYRIGLVEALSSGIMDMHLVYDKIKDTADSKSIKIDFTNNIILFSKKNKHFSILFIDLFGKIDGKEDNDYWYALRKPRKKYGRMTYVNTIRFFNPIVVNHKYVENLKKETEIEYKDFVAITGFYHLEFTHKKIISPYEIISIAD